MRYLVFYVTLIIFAPVPMPKPPKPLPLPLGKWIKATWNKRKWDVRFNLNGSYNAKFDSVDWHGSYSWCPLTRTLIIQEWNRQSDNGVKYKVILDKKLYGISDGVSIDLGAK